MNSRSPRTILISGGAGFVGSRLARSLSADGHEVVCFDNLHPQVHPQGKWLPELHDAAVLVEGDVTRLDDWIVAMERRPDVIVHLAAETATGQSLHEATRHGATNVVGTTQLLDACSRTGHQPTHVLLSSSRAVYGEGEWTTAQGVRFHPGPRLREDLEQGRWDPRSPDGTSIRPLASSAASTVPHPASVYAATKLAQEHLLLAWGNSMGVPVTVLRIQNAYGEGQSLSNPYTGIVALFARLAVEGRTIPIYEDGQILRDFVHIDDVVQAFRRAIASRPLHNRLVDIGSGQPVTMLEVASLISNIANAPDPNVTGDFRHGDVRAASCELETAARQLGYQPRRTLEDGLRALIAWVREFEIAHRKAPRTE